MHQCKSPECGDITAFGAFYMPGLKNHRIYGMLNTVNEDR